MEPFRGVQRPRVMYRSFTLLVLLAVASTGCLGQSVQGDCSGGALHGNHCVPDTPGAKAALILGAMPIPPRNEYPQRTPTCSVKGEIATCEEFDHMGNLIRARFKIVTRRDRSDTLAPICRSATHPSRPTSVFCTQ